MPGMPVEVEHTRLGNAKEDNAKEAKAGDKEDIKAEKAETRETTKPKGAEKTSAN
jgi:hypothetical protein